MNKFGITTLLKNLPLGSEFGADQWPPHITQVDTLQTDHSLEDIAKKLEDTLRTQSSVVTVIESREIFGPNKNIEVLKLVNNPEVSSLHNRIVESLETINAEFRRPFILKDNFQPHITILPELNLSIGDRVEIEQITIIDKNDPNIRRVACNIKLK